MPQANSPSRSGNINIRVALEQRNLIDQAASLCNKTRTDFILEAATKAARDAILDQVLYPVSAERFEAFQRLLDSPPEENERLRVLMARKPRWGK
ncbi:DUF1778 domain-containing protein [Desulfolutivibrio sulfoxidireducens]|uniref:type II toxin-antitoxin system TacA family antitoxin n=1 Tax=Desulfolutivibrio sulfoxidireducens TaxID=2773299 RepID=UPI00159DD7B5|nr:DUF1778 domain-containing protein [Desulfolutivibrio sulfoxidireducens]QLA17361.1 DUF1778 domain-containing protein [Desulfolutivibrio sulfoxidireducens]QLA20958.1 DUF1778 domain-containing protein [Desulfolutivibrio sulfoxidireducens]